MPPDWGCRITNGPMRFFFPLGGVTADEGVHRYARWFTLDRYHEMCDHVS
jgi:hypothetical protein